MYHQVGLRCNASVLKDLLPPNLPQVSLSFPSPIWDMYTNTYPCSQNPELLLQLQQLPQPGQSRGERWWQRLPV